jgi:hypothetical protein
MNVVLPQGLSLRRFASRRNAARRLKGRLAGAPPLQLGMRFENSGKSAPAVKD